MDLASASRLPTTSPSISTSAKESVLVLDRTMRSPVQYFYAVSDRAYRQDADRHRSGIRAPLPAGR